MFIPIWLFVIMSLFYVLLLFIVYYLIKLLIYLFFESDREFDRLCDNCDKIIENNYLSLNRREIKIVNKLRKLLNTVENEDELFKITSIWPMYIYTLIRGFFIVNDI